MKKEDILNKLKELKPIYKSDGIEIIGLFGSYADGYENQYSDIDVAYRLDYDKFSQKYVDGFSKILRIDDVKNELQSILKTKVDFVSDKNKKIMGNLINV